MLLLAPFLGLTNALGLRLLLVPTAPPGPNHVWARLSRLQRTLLMAALVTGGALCLVIYAGLSGLLGDF